VACVINPLKNLDDLSAAFPVTAQNRKNPDLQTGLIFPIIIATLWKEWLYAKAKE
jgi:hypothetical protein